MSETSSVVAGRTAQDEIEQVVGDVLDGTAYRELPTETLKLMLANAVHAWLNARPVERQGVEW
jgi:hypothetical protein